MAIKAFLCSISEYNHFSQLPFCKNESEYVANALMEKLCVLPDDICFATRSGNISNVEYMKNYTTFISNLCEDDIVIIYFSGHGGVDDEYNDLILFTSNSINSQTGLPSANLTEYLHRANVKNVICFFDCCYSGLGIENLKTIDNIEDTILNHIGTGSAIITSCSKNQVSYPFDDNISVFTKMVIDALGSRFVYKEGCFDLNEFRNMIAVYSRVWNTKNPDKIQVPLFRTNMFGMLRIPINAPIDKREDNNGLIYNTEYFNLYNISTHRKFREDVFLHTVTATVLLKYDYDESNIYELLNTAVEFLLNQRVYNNSNIIWLYICNDEIDLENHYYPYRSVWVNKQQSYWLNHLGKNRIISGNIAWQKESYYEMNRQNYLDNIMPDEDIFSFWKEILEKQIRISTKAIEDYHSYRNNEITIEELCHKHSVLYKQVIPLCNKADDAPFTMPGSSLKSFDRNALVLSGDVQELFLFYGLKNNRSEKNKSECFEISLNRYYTDLNKIKEFLS